MIKKIVSRLNVHTTHEILTVSTIEEAIKYRHIGGPTVQVDGIDIEPAARTIEQFALA